MLYLQYQIVSQRFLVPIFPSRPCLDRITYSQLNIKLTFCCIVNTTTKILTGKAAAKLEPLFNKPPLACNISNSLSPSIDKGLCRLIIKWRITVRGLWEPTSWPLTKTKTIQIVRYSVSQQCCDSYLYSSWLQGSISLNIFGVNLLTLFISWAILFMQNCKQYCYSAIQLSNLQKVWVYWLMTKGF